MQALCYKCNTQKRNRDDTDFMLWHKRLQFRKHGCPMCARDCALAGSDELQTPIHEPDTCRAKPLHAN